MNKIITLTVMCFVAIAAVAQEKADIKVSYKAYSPNMKDGTVDVIKNFVLLANADHAKFYSPVTDYIDSLNSTPEGQAKYKEMTRNAYFSNKLDDMPKRDPSLYVVSSLVDGSVKCYDTAGLDKFVTNESIEVPDWVFDEDSTQELLGYECMQATANYHGRKWTVWFTTDIPLSFGPWKLVCPLGLILKASADEGLYEFIATGLEKTDSEIGPIYLTDEYEPTSRSAFYKAKRDFMENPLGKLNAQLGVSITKADTGNSLEFLPREKIDFIETDY